MKVDEMAREAADALHISVARLEPPPIEERSGLGRVGVGALARVAVLLLVVTVGVGWWATRDDTEATTTSRGDVADVDIPRLGLLSPQWRATVPVELPLPEGLAERLPNSLVDIDEGVVVVYEDADGSGAFLTLTSQPGDIDEYRGTAERADAATSDIQVAGAAGFEASFDTTADEADVRAVAWAPTPGVVATLALTGFDTAAVDLVALAESATPLDDQTWVALQEITGWAAAIRSATGDYDTEPIDVDALEVTDLVPPVELVAALAGLDVGAIDVATDTAPEEGWRTLAGGETLPLTANGHIYSWSTGSVRVLLAITLDDAAASAADELMSGSGDGEESGLTPDETSLDSANVFRRADRLLVHVEIDAWPDDLARKSAEAIAAAIVDSAATVGPD